MKKGYLLVTALILLAAVAVFVAAIMGFVSNTSSLRVSKEKLVMASNDSMSGVQMGTSYLAHFSNAIGGFDVDFSGPGGVPFNSIPWLQQNTPNNYFNSIYSSVDGEAWKSALSALATDSNVLWLNKIPQVESLFDSLQASGVLKVIPDVVIIQTKIPHTDENSEYKYFVVSRATIDGKTAYSSGFAVANFLNRYVYFTQEEPPYSSSAPNVTFMNGDTLDGPVRTNGTLVTRGHPDFKGYVEYGGLYKIPGYGSPIFESGSATLSYEDINSMNMSKIASDYSNKINSEVSSPSAIKSAGITSTPVGLDLSIVYDNLIKKWSDYGFNFFHPHKWEKSGYWTLSKLVSAFETGFDSWLWWSNLLGGHSYTLDQLPKVIQNDYDNVIASIKGIPSLKATFSPGNSGSNANTITIYYGIDTSNAISALEHLVEDLKMYGYIPYYPEELYKELYHVLGVLNGYANPHWRKLLQINPTNRVPGTSKISIESGSKSLLGLTTGSSPITFNFNGVIKTTSDLVIGEKNKPSRVSGRYTIYTTRSAVINGNIVYDYANQALGKNPSWISSPISSSDVAKIRNATGTDFLNIVSNYDIALTDTSQYPKIMASLYAFNGTFWYPNYENAWVENPGQMFVYGSTMQYEGGRLFGHHSDNSLVSGYHEYYVYDWRILEGLPSNTYGTPSAKGKALLLSVRTVY